MNDKPKQSIFDCNVFDPAEIPCEEIRDPSALVKKPLVSANMPTFNHVQHIAQAIEGVLHQKTNHSFELVIGEDCSTDGTREIVFEYQKKYPNIIRVITSEKNVGAQKNSFRTGKACRGKYIAWCEGDDYWHCRDKLQKQVDFLEKHQDYGLVNSEVRMCKIETGEIVEAHNRFLNKNNSVFRNENGSLFNEVLAQNYLIWTCTVCVRRDLLEQVVSSDPIVFASDRFMMGDKPHWLELSRLTKFKYMDEALATYNYLPESACHSKDIRKHMKFHFSCFDLNHYYVQKYGCTDKLSKRLLGGQVKSLLTYSYVNKDAKMAKIVKEKSKYLSFRQRLLYWGSIYPITHLLLLPLVNSRKFIDETLKRLKCMCHI